MYKFPCIITFLLLLAIPCWAGGNKDKGAESVLNVQQRQNAPAPVAPLTLARPVYWTGEGGKGESIAILAPKATGLATNQSYLPALVQGEFVSNFSGYSAISVLDRQHLDDQYAELLSGYYADNAQAGLDLGHLSPTDYIMGGNITRTATGYTLQIQITKTTDKMTMASYSGTFTFVELDNLTGIRRASLELLEKMGVTPTERTRTELSGAATANHVNAQTALAQGIIAQKSGTVVEALSRFIQSNNYDPSLVEAASRMNILSTSISSGNIGEDTRNDIVWRRQWVERLQETETFFANYIKEVPYTLVYDTNIKQGTINYQNETVNLSFWMGLLRDEQWVSTINEVIRTVQSGLVATERSTTWGLDWPDKSVSTPSPFADKRNNFTVAVEIINDQGKTIGKQTFTIPSGYTIRYGNIAPIQWEKFVSFPTVDANLITDRLTLRITSIDGIPAEDAATKKKINIIPQSTGDHKLATDESLFTVSSDGSLKPNWNGYFSDSPKDVVIPSTVRGVLVTTIAMEAFRGHKLTVITIPNTVITIGRFAFYSNSLTSVNIPNSVREISDEAFHANQLTSVTIPNSVIIIGNSAFAGNKLTSVNIPNSVREIGSFAFVNNKLTSVTIPNSVRKIGWRAFAGNNLTSVNISNSVREIDNVAFEGNSITSITIGANVNLGDNSFGKDGFVDFYNQNGKKAGKYTRSGGNWIYTP
jgi:hypothetical protein